MAGMCEIIRVPETVENVTQTLTPVLCVTSVDIHGVFTAKEYHQIFWTIFYFPLNIG